MKPDTNKYKIAVIGAGNGGQAIAGYLAIEGHEVNLYSRNLRKISRIIENGGIYLTGLIEGFGIIKTISDKLKKVIEGCSIIMICTTADAHKEIAQNLAPIISENQLVVLNPGRTLGAFEFRNVLDQNNLNKSIYVVEAQTLLFACRVEIPGTVRIIGSKENVYYSALPKEDLQFVSEIMNQISNSFKLVENTLITSLENFGAIFHTIIVLFNASKIERGEEFYFYNDITPQVCSLLEKIDKERLALGRAFNLQLKSAEEWITFAYTNISGNDLFSKMRYNPAYYKIMAPTTIFSRYFLEDIPTGILPMLELAKIAKIKLPLMQSIYELASNLLEIDFKQEGRTLANLNLENMNTNHLLNIL